MSGKNLEHQIGELTGILRQLTPALERLEERMTDVEKANSAKQVEVQHLQQQFSSFRDQFSKSFEDFRKKTSNEAGRQAQNMSRINTDVKTNSEAIARIEKKSDGLKGRLWDLAKILVAAALGAAGTKFLK